MPAVPSLFRGADVMSRLWTVQARKRCPLRDAGVDMALRSPLRTHGATLRARSMVRWSSATLHVYFFFIEYHQSPPLNPLSKWTRELSPPLLARTCHETYAFLRYARRTLFTTVRRA